MPILTHRKRPIGYADEWTTEQQARDFAAEVRMRTSGTLTDVYFDPERSTWIVTQYADFLVSAGAK